MSSTESESDSARSRGEEEEEEVEKLREADEDEDENGHNSEEDDGKSISRSQSSAPPPSSKSLTTLAFPISRVRRLVKSEADVQWVGVEAGFLIAKAAELFLEKFVEDAFDKMTDNERTTLTYKDLAAHVSRSERMDFLADFVPETIPVSIASTLAKEQDDK